MNIERKVLDGATLNVIQSKKFKTIDISIKFCEPLDKSVATKRSLLPFVLKASMRRFPSKKGIMKELERMYGASTSANVNKLGNLSVTTFGVTIIDPKYVDYPNLFFEAVDFLKDIVYDPFLENGRFSSKVVEEEKRLLVDEILASQDEKTKFAISQLIKIMCPDEVYQTNILGYLDEVEGLNVDNIFEYYQSFLKKDQIVININGDVSEEMIDYVQKTLIVRKENFNYPVLDHETKKIVSVNEVIESQRINQTKLNIGYRTNTLLLDNDYYAMLMFSSILGGYPHSKLFTNVREKNSLCYYVASRLDALKPIMLIYAGIDSSKYEDALRIIKEQISEIQNGNITDNELELTKKAIENDIRESLDSQISLSIKAFNDSLLNREFDISSRIEHIKAVTKEEIINASKKIELDSIYLLKGEMK